ncbi:NAD-dependent epimerase/dehydratase family protein [Bilifractor sp. LCP21S3_A7]|uniref:NAD-dependent epimerase/dehydratase family protein n=1 Tax=Bilifractor sp. LCP21S3_A7 TaxID=3438738 RepID=UPI003F926829
MADEQIRKCIITGASGFIGKALIRELNRQNVKVYAVVRNLNSDILGMDELINVKIVFCPQEEIDKLSQMITDNDIDCCIHLAWAGTSGAERADYILQISNITNTLRTIDTLKKIGVKRFVGVGTLAEKDVLNYHLCDGSTPNAVSNYGTAKLSAHLFSKTLCCKNEMEYVWCCLANTFGEENTTSNFVNMACMKMLKGERAAFTAGEQLYDLNYISDTVKALVAASFYGHSGTSYYLGSGHPRKLKEYIRIIRDTIDPDIPLYLGEIPYNGRSLSEEDYSIAKLTTDTEFIPEVSFETGIRNTVEWLKSRR